MNSIIIVVGFLFIPFLLLYFITKSKKSKTRYSHFPLIHSGKQKIIHILLNYFYLYLDLIFDLVMMILIVLMLYNIFPVNSKKDLIIIDASYSVKMNGLSAICKQIEKVNKEKTNNKIEYYVLGFDEKAAKVRLTRDKKIKKLFDSQSIYEHLNNKYIFFNSDYSELAKLKNVKPENIHLYTDFFPYENTNIDIVEFQEKIDMNVFYPVSDTYNFLDHSYSLGIQYFGNQLEIPVNNAVEIEKCIYTPDNKGFTYEKLKIHDDYSLKYFSSDKIMITLPAAGTYIIRINNDSFVFNLEEMNLNIKPVGDFANAINATSKIENIQGNKELISYSFEPVDLDTKKIKSFNADILVSVIDPGKYKKLVQDLTIEDAAPNSEVGFLLLNNSGNAFQDKIIFSGDQDLLYKFLDKKIYYFLFINMYNLFNNSLPALYTQLFYDYFNEMKNHENHKKSSYFLQIKNSFIYKKGDSIKPVNLMLSEFQSARKDGEMIILPEKASYFYLIIIFLFFVIKQLYLVVIKK